MNYFILGEFDSAEEYGSSAPESGLFALSVSACGRPATIILIACLIIIFIKLQGTHVVYPMDTLQNYLMLADILIQTFLGLQISALLNYQVHTQPHS